MIEKTLEILKEYGVHRSYAKFLCLDDEMAIYQVKLIDYNYKDKYSSKFKPFKHIFTFSIIGLRDLFPTMPVLDLVTDKGVKYVEVLIEGEVRDGFETIKEQIETIGFNLNE